MKPGIRTQHMYNIKKDICSMVILKTNNKAQLYNMIIIICMYKKLAEQ